MISRPTRNSKRDIIRVNGYYGLALLITWGWLPLAVCRTRKWHNHHQTIIFVLPVVFHAVCLHYNGWLIVSQNIVVMTDLDLHHAFLYCAEIILKIYRNGCKQFATWHCSKLHNTEFYLFRSLWIDYSICITLFYYPDILLLLACHKQLLSWLDVDKVKSMHVWGLYFVGESTNPGFTCFCENIFNEIVREIYLIFFSHKGTVFSLNTWMN